MPDKMKPDKPFEEMTTDELVDFQRRREDKLIAEFVAEREAHERYRKRAFRGYIVLFGAVLISLGGAYAAISKNSEAIDKINDERAARTSGFSSIIERGCNTDNNQDLLLARLVAASLAQPPFGTGADLSNLDAFDVQVLNSINDVIQSIPEDSPLQQRFEEVQRQLEDTEDCKALVESVLSGEPIPPPSDGND